MRVGMPRVCTLVLFIIIVITVEIFVICFHNYYGHNYIELYIYYTSEHILYNNIVVLECY